MLPEKAAFKRNLVSAGTNREGILAGRNIVSKVKEIGNCRCVLGALRRQCMSRI